MVPCYCKFMPDENLWNLCVVLNLGEMSFGVLVHVTGNHYYPYISQTIRLFHLKSTFRDVKLGTYSTSLTALATKEINIF